MLMRLDALMQERYWLCNEHSRAKRMSSRQPARREMRHAGVKQVLDVLMQVLDVLRRHHENSEKGKTVSGSKWLTY